MLNLGLSAFYFITSTIQSISNNYYALNMDINILQVQQHLRSLQQANQVQRNDHINALNTYGSLRLGAASAYEQPKMQSVMEEFKKEEQLYSTKDTKVLVMRKKCGNTQLVAKITGMPRTSTSASLHLGYQAYFYTKLIQTNVSHIAKMHNIIFNGQNCTRLMEYACRGDLTDYVQNPVSNSDSLQEKMQKLKAIKNILWQTIKGIEQVHSLGFAVRDLKPSNILINHEGKIVLCDFGLVAPLGQVDSSICGTPQYMPPQRLSNKRETMPIHQNIDFWALGIVAFQLIMGYTPYTYEQGDFHGLVESMYEGYISFDDQLPNSCRRFIFNLLQTNPAKRMSLQAIKDHQFFKDLEQVPLTSLRCKCNKSS